MIIESIRGLGTFVTLFTIATMSLAISLRTKHLRIISTTIVVLSLVSVALIFVGSRPITAGNDTLSYAHTFSNLNSIASAPTTGQAYYGGSEPLFWKLSYLIKLVSSSPEAYLLAVSFISVLLLITANKVLAHTQPTSLTIWFACLTYSSYSMVYFANHMRASVAIPIALISIGYAMREKYVSAVLICLIATGFHSSAIIIAPLIALYYVYTPSGSKRETYTMIGITLAAPILANTITSFIPKLADILGQRFSEKANLYTTTAFNIDSIFQTFNFWFAAGHVVLLLAFRRDKLHLSVLYLFIIVLILSPLPKVSERYIAYLLPLLPISIYYSLSSRTTRSTALAAISLFYLLVATLMLNTESARYTLSL